MRYDAKLNNIVQTAVMLNQVGDNVMSTLEGIEKRLRKGGVGTEVWLEDQPVDYDGRKWALGFARFDGRYRLAVRVLSESSDPGYATPLKHSPRLLRLRAASAIEGLLDALQTALTAQADEAAAAARSAEEALGGLAELADED